MTPHHRVLKPKPQRRLLALDGGGIRGIITIEILGAIETALRVRMNNPALVLADWFDYVGGTSTGAIIATCVSLGMTVAAIRDFYHKNGAIMFDRARLLQRLWYTYDSNQLATKLREVLGAETTLGSADLHTLLLLVMRNATTDSPWPLSNNPDAMYNKRTYSNLSLPLWQLVRASTAAPTFFPPEQITVNAGEPPHLFVDGGVTTYNNPAFLLFLMATLKPYELCWETGEDKLLLVSIGTGSSPTANKNLAPWEMNLLYNAQKIPAALMYASLVQQDMLCRTFGCCEFGAPIDREIGDLCGIPAPGGAPKSFTYCRYEPELSPSGLAALGLSKLRIEDVQEMDSVAHIDDLKLLGKVYAEASFRPAHLSRFLPGLQA